MSRTDPAPWCSCEGALGDYLATSAQLVLVAIDDHGTVLHCNRGFLVLTELDAPPIGRPLTELVGGAPAATLARIIDASPEDTTRLQLRAASGATHVLTARVLAGADGQRLLVGERLMLTESALLERMAGLHAEVVNITRALRKEKTALQRAHDEIKQLHGLLPICSYCKKIRDDNGYWTRVEQYLYDRTGVEFSHGMCRECAEREFPGVDFDDG